ncbi:MAG: hypothetical protein J1F63_02305 [Oscillospiraceae bacterium]|nr:hypothetical protein [Oscillospiraceae bacterium]
MQTEQNKQAKKLLMHCWALQYGRYVEVLEPISLRNKIAQSICRMAEKYGADSAEFYKFFKKEKISFNVRPL